MTVPALPPGTRPGTGGYTAQLPAAAGTVGQLRRVASVAGKHHVEQWYTPVSQQDITDAVAAIDLTGLATESYVDTAISDIALPTRDSLGLDTDDSPTFGAVFFPGNPFIYGDGGALRTRGPFAGSILDFQNCGGIDFRSSTVGTNVALRTTDGILQQRNGPNPQEYQIYEQDTSGTNRSYLSIRAQTGGDFVIEPVGVGATTRGLNIRGLSRLQNDALMTLGHSNGVNVMQCTNSQMIYYGNQNFFHGLKSRVGIAAWNAAMPTSQPATPTDQAEIIAILQAYGLCS